MFRKLILSLAAALLIATFPLAIAHAHPQNIQISVSRDGFNHMAGYSVDVEAGHEVTITLTYGDGDLSTDNPHVIMIYGLGLNLQPLTVSRDNPTASITFIPPKTGTLTIVCIVPCIGMENQLDGRLKVVIPKTSGATSSLTLELSPREDGNAQAVVLVNDASGSPIGGVPVGFTMLTSVGGKLDLGTSVTAEDGRAVLTITAKPGITVRIRAVYEDSRGTSAENTAEITMPGTVAETPLRSLSLPTAPPLLALILIVVLGGIWTIYATVVYQIIRILRG